MRLRNNVQAGDNSQAPAPDNQRRTTVYLSRMTCCWSPCSHLKSPAIALRKPWWQGWHSPSLRSWPALHTARETARRSDNGAAARARPKHGAIDMPSCWQGEFIAQRRSVAAFGLMVALDLHAHAAEAEETHHKCHVHSPSRARGSAGTGAAVCGRQWRRPLPLRRRRMPPVPPATRQHAGPCVEHL